MKTSRTRIAQVIAETTLKSGSSKKLAREVAAYLMSEGRVYELDSIMRDVQADWAVTGYVEVEAASAHKLTPQVRSDITAQMKKLFPKSKKVVISEVYDPDVLGGVRLSLANQQLDLSVEAKLNKFKQLTLSRKD